MKEGILGPKVEKVAIAVTRNENPDSDADYYVYLLNLRDDIMEGIIVTSKGYGHNANTGEKVQTSVLRHTIEVLLPNEVAKIEPIAEEVLALSNEYWVSFWVNDIMYDKKYVFLAESIQEKNMKMIPELGTKGVIIM